MKKMTSKLNWPIMSVILLAIIMASITIFIVNKEKEKIANQEPEKIYVGYNDEKLLENFSREEAVNSMQTLLKGIEQDVDGKERTIEERMKALDNPDAELEDVINKATIDKLYLSEEFKKEKFNRQFTASVLLTYYQLISETTDSQDFNPLVEDFSDIVYLDNKMKTAHIPLDVFIGDNKGIAFEMQYIDGEWKFNPYTSMMSLVMVVNYEGQMEQILKGKNESVKDADSKEKEDK